ncbi:MAG: tRNA uridine-5-carboxymethylaminomethyl(34) synthesis GTPase MnmE [Treponema sp.]|nr:tRNA uridine-5-carboxymethylaminomethyl(34) synthesis GTPase MnmE [Treponema sp.]
MTNISYTPEEPIAAIATALAPGAIGIVRTTGKNCISLMASIFSRPRALQNAAANSLVYGWLLDADSNGRIDEVMLGVYKAPKSFTGEDMVEIYCHGGVSVVTAVLNLLLKNGFRQAERGEFTFRAYINGKTDLTKAEAIKEIIDSKTDVSRGRAVGRLAGNLFAEIDSIKKCIVDTLAAIEVEIEYPEDEETIADSFDSFQLEEARQRLASLVHSWKSEKLYQDGARVVLCGKTNAGKSSLFNALLKEERAIVSDIEGTTRDWLESWASFEGIPVRLFDTAGLRSTSDVIEAEGVERTRDLSSEADVILYLVDASAGLSEEDRMFLSEKKETPIILVWNKCDKGDDFAIEMNGDDAYKSDVRAEVRLSAKNGNGLGTLIGTAKRILCGGEETDRNAAGLGSQRQRNSVSEALERIEHALVIANDGSYGLDAVVQDLEDCLDSLGEVTGEVTPDDVLGAVFANFCVGK